MASYNIHLGIGRDGDFKPQRIAAVIRELQADIVALQEVALGAPAFNMLEYLSGACGMSAIAGPTLVTPHGDYGNAILTHYRAIHVRRLDLSVARREPRGALVVELDCSGQRLCLIATHLGLRPAERREQIRRLLQSVHDAGAVPTVLIGDLRGQPVVGVFLCSYGSGAGRVARSAGREPVLGRMDNGVLGAAPAGLAVRPVRNLDDQQNIARSQDQGVCRTYR